MPLRFENVNLKINSDKDYYLSPLGQSNCTHWKGGFLRFFIDKPYSFAFQHVKSLQNQAENKKQYPDAMTLNKAENIALLVFECIPIINIGIGLIDYVVDKARIEESQYIQTRFFLRTLQDNYKFIKKNINTNSLSRVIAQTKVFFLGETHEVAAHRKANGDFINALWVKKSQTFTESLFQNQSSQVDFVKDEYKKELQSWDIVDKSYLHTSTKAQLIESFFTLLILFDQFKNLDHWSEEILKENYNHLIIELQILREEVDPHFTTPFQFDEQLKFLTRDHDLKKINYHCIDHLLNLWMNTMEILSQNEYEGVIAHFYERNAFMLNNVLKAFNQGASKIFVLTGSAHVNHLTNEPNFIKGVDLLYQELNKANIPYATFVPRNHPISLFDRPSGYSLDSWISAKEKDLSKAKYQPSTLQKYISDSEKVSQANSLADIEKGVDLKKQEYDAILESKCSNTHVNQMSSCIYILAKKHSENLRALIEKSPLTEMNKPSGQITVTFSKDDQVFEISTQASYFIYETLEKGSKLHIQDNLKFLELTGFYKPLRELFPNIAEIEFTLTDMETITVKNYWK